MYSKCKWTERRGTSKQHLSVKINLLKLNTSRKSVFSPGSVRSTISGGVVSQWYLIELIQSYWPVKGPTETGVPLWTDPQHFTIHRPEASEGQGGINPPTGQGSDPLQPAKARSQAQVWPTPLNTLLIALGWFATYRLIRVFMSSRAQRLHCISVWHIHLFTYLSRPSCIIHISIHLSSESTSIQGLP